MISCSAENSTSPIFWLSKKLPVFQSQQCGVFWLLWLPILDKQNQVFVLKNRHYELRPWSTQYTCRNSVRSRNRCMIGGTWSLFHALTKVPSFLPSFLITPLLMSSAMGRIVLCKTFLCSDKQGWLGWWLRLNIDSAMMTSSCLQFINSRQAWDFSLGTWHYW